MQHRPSDDDLAVACETLDDLRRGVGDVLERLGDDLADTDDLVAHENFEDLIGHAAQAIVLLGGQTGREQRDLAGKVLAHRVIAVAREDQIGLNRGRRVRRDGGAHLGIAVLGEEIEQLRPQLGVRRGAQPVVDFPALREALRFFVSDRRSGTRAEDALQEADHGEPPGVPDRGSADAQPDRSAMAKLPLPRCFTRYIAASARASSASGGSGWPGS